MSTVVSVIIPTYNRAQYLSDCIESVLNQKKANFSLEVIVVDDGSTDETEKALSPFRSKIRYKKIPNSGRPAIPRNIGIRMATGNLIAFQDSDDQWVANKLSVQLPVLNDPSVVLSYGNTEIITETGKKTGQTVVNSEQAHSGSVFTELVKVNFISTLTVVTRPQVLQKAGCFNESAAIRGVEDYDLWLKVARLGNVQYINKILAYYRSHSQNISTGSTYVDSKKILSIMNSIDLSSLDNLEKKAVIHKKAALYKELTAASEFPENSYWLAKTVIAKLLP